MEEGGVFKISIRNKAGVVAHAKVSAVHHEILSKMSWSLSKTGYPTASKKYKGQKLMHRIVMAMQDETLTQIIFVDHINGDKLDNRIENLRKATAAQNARNVSKSNSVCSSKYLGVYFNKGNRKFIARLKCEGVMYRIGQYDTEKEAARARDCFLVHQEDKEKFRHKLNFPELVEELKQDTPPLIVHEAKSKTSIYRGVSLFWDGFFVGELKKNGKRLLHQRNKDPVVCAKAVDACIVNNKLNMKLNFPEDYPNYVFQEQTLVFQTIDETTMKLPIPTRQNMYTKIESKDYELIKHCRIFETRGYIIVKHSSFKQGIPLHRYLMQATDPTMYVDHIDGDPLNNCRSNLRIVTVQQNAQNKSKKKNTASLFYGVSKAKKGFKAQLRNGDFTYEKSFKQEHHAARDRDLVILKLFPNEMYKMNFVWTEEEIDDWSFFLLNKFYTK